MSISAIGSGTGAMGLPPGLQQLSNGLLALNKDEAAKVSIEPCATPSSGGASGSAGHGEDGPLNLSMKSAGPGSASSASRSGIKNLRDVDAIILTHLLSAYDDNYRKLVIIM